LVPDARWQHRVRDSAVGRAFDEPPLGRRVDPAAWRHRGPWGQRSASPAHVLRTPRHVRGRPQEHRQGGGRGP
ncbi:unnamed protein product, partial [Ectocarpus sp. 12 AP-2014]